LEKIKRLKRIEGKEVDFTGYDMKLERKGTSRMSDPMLDAMLASIDSNPSMSAAEKAEMRKTVFSSYAGSRSAAGPPVVKAAKGAGETGASTLETEETKNRRKAQTIATRDLGVITNQEQWVGPISQELLTFMTEATEGTHGAWAKRFFEEAKRETPGEIATRKEFLDILMKAAPGKEIADLSGDRQTDRIVRRQCFSFACDCFLVKLISLDSVMVKLSNKEKDAKRVAYRELVMAPMADTAQSDARAFDSSLDTAMKARKVEEKRMVELRQESDASEDEAPSKKKTATGKGAPAQGRSSKNDKKVTFGGPGLEESAKLGREALALLNKGKKPSIPKSYSQLWTRAERFAFTRAGGFCEPCAMEDGVITKGLKVDHEQHLKDRDSKKKK